MPDRQTAYTTWVSFAQAAEAISWNRFNAFLVFSTLLALTWGALYSLSSRDLPAPARVVQVLVCVFGVVSGLVWAGLGRRTRQFLTFFLKGGAALEDGADEACQVCKRALKEREGEGETQYRYLGSYYVHVGTAGAFIVLYLSMFIASWMR